MINTSIDMLVMWCLLSLLLPTSPVYCIDCYRYCRLTLLYISVLSRSTFPCHYYYAYSIIIILIIMGLTIKLFPLMCRWSWFYLSSKGVCGCKDSAGVASLHPVVLRCPWGWPTQSELRNHTKGILSRNITHTHKQKVRYIFILVPAGLCECSIVTSAVNICASN